MRRSVPPTARTVQWVEIGRIAIHSGSTSRPSGVIPRLHPAVRGALWEMSSRTACKTEPSVAVVANCKSEVVDIASRAIQDVE